MNKEDFVSLEVAKLLQKKGFKEQCLAYYHNDVLLFVTVPYRSVDIFGILECSISQMYDGIPCPTLYEVQKWLWQKHELLVTVFIEAPFAKPYQFMYCIQDSKNTIDDYGTIVSEKSYSSIQEALNIGVLEALKLI